MNRYCLALVMLVPLSTLSAADPAVTFGTLSSVPPKNWKSEEPSNRLRSHQFKVPSGDKTLADADVIVSPLSRPKPEQVFPGWKSQFAPPEGKTLDEVAKESTVELKGATLHILDVHGTWSYKERPFDPRSKVETKPHFRTIWVIVVVKDEATHVRFSGPEAVIEKNKKAFDEWLKAMK